MSRRPGARSRRFPTSAGGGGGFLPTNLSGCVLWLRADKGITIATGVSQWNDQSGGGNNVAQATGTAQPAFNAAGGPNGMPYLQFTSTSSQFLSNASVLAAGTSITMFAMAKAAFTTINAIVCEGDATHGVVLAVNASASNSEVDIVVNNVAVEQGPASSATGAWQGWTMTGSAAPLQTLRINGLPVTLSSNNNAPVAGGTGTFIGSVSAATWFWNGGIAEVIVYNSVLSAGQIGQVESYFLSRYGIA